MDHGAIRREIHHGRVVRCFAERPASIDALFRAAAARRPDAVALVAGAERLTYRELDERVEHLARNLAKRGLEPGDRLALLLGNGPEFVLSFLAAARLGAIIVPLNVRQREPEIRFMLAHSEAKILIYDRDLAGELPNSADVPRLLSRIATGTTGPGDHFDDLMSPAPQQAFTAPDEDHAFCILYTSGTTGTPKGATLTHFGVIHSALHYEYALGLKEGEVSALAVPASHVTGLIAILVATLQVAGTAVLMPAFKAGDFLRLVERERITYTVMVPAMYNLLLLTPELARTDLSSWRIGGFGGAPMPAETIARLARSAPGLGLMNIYGATETSSPATILPARYSASHRDSVGLALPCAEIAVLDPEGREVAAGQMGELFISGPMTIPYYWNNPEANATSFVDGFWRSGDIGSIHAAGFVRIHDRLKDVINRGGYKIYCIEVEGVIAACSGVEEVAVVGYPDPVLGERVAAFVHAPGGGAIGAAVRDHCRRNLSDYKVPDIVQALDAPLPRNANGKILKTALRSLLRA